MGRRYIRRRLIVCSGGLPERRGRYRYVLYEQLRNTCRRDCYMGFSANHCSTCWGSTPTICAIAPGVLGVTGIETMEMVRSIVQSVHPRAVIAVDSLAARSISRVGSAVQLTDTGIQPGSGVGNHRSALTEESLGVPVIALGVPMVIYAATIARDAFELLAGEDDSAEQEEALDQMAEELLAGSMGEMIVTPREVDALVEDAANMLSCGINRALHPGLSPSDLLTMMNP